MPSSPLVIYFCDWAVFSLSGGEQLGVQHPATKCYPSCPIFRPTSIDAGWCTRPFIEILEYIINIKCRLPENSRDRRLWPPMELK